MRGLQSRRRAASSTTSWLTGRSRDNARRRLKYSYDALKVLQRVWAASGGQCGKYLAVSMRVQLDGLERHGEFVDGHDRYRATVRDELLAMSAASIDRYLAGAEGQRPGPGEVGHQTLAAAVLDLDP